MSNAKLVKKGEDGEAEIRKLLRNLDKTDYIVVNDLTLRYAEDRTTQIDHIVISSYGVFCIETKNYSGELLILLDSDKWRYRSPSSGKKKNSKYENVMNPYRQNDFHISILAGITGLEKSKFANIVVFVDSDLDITGTESGCILWKSELLPYIKLATEVIFSFKDMQDILKSIIPFICTSSEHTDKF